jgi:hypothetical protein
MGRTRRKRQDLLDMYAGAAARVGNAADTRVAWLTRLVRLQTQNLGDVECLEAGYFTTGGAAGVVLNPPSATELDQARAWLKRAFDELRDERRGVVLEAGWRGELVYDYERGVGSVLLTDDLPFQDAFRLRVFDAITSLAHERYWLKFCVACRRAFVSKRRDAGKCSPTCRSNVWRGKTPNRERLNDARIARYDRQQPQGVKTTRARRRKRDHDDGSSEAGT